ncbi:twin-arginine translocase subunit TatB [Candidatus Symbiopectobacterium sp. 'North America']|uniref:Sec-independent protein translocase protein TatB n=1 Tax=Candidatus Symbiopectobacterium sp. 'North America' TaxID=2794574 RepID=UPI0018CBB108|nr:Sec-independent protein translocase protein TatB [Candidatus Symbiopectobacterium sp. 'North America']MBG6246182.1 twin-arginine translocase subunit TatB [Candidatus Symbiopectobacterium sp. 'North America']
MFDIGFGELMIVMVIGLVVLGPERLPVAVKTIAGWVRTLRSLTSAVQNELTQELKLQELQDSLKKVEQASLKNLSPELKASMDELKEAADAMRRGYAKPGDSATAQLGEVPHKPLADAEAAHDGVIKAEQASSPTALPSVDQPAAALSSSLIDVAPPAVVNSAPEAPSATALPDNTPAVAALAPTDDVPNKRAAPASAVAPSQPSADER